jgi:hypothetical protein
MNASGFVGQCPPQKFESEARQSRPITPSGIFRRSGSARSSNPMPRCARFSCSIVRVEPGRLLRHGRVGIRCGVGHVPVRACGAIEHDV